MEELLQISSFDILALNDDGVVIHNKDAKVEDLAGGKEPDDDVRLPNGKPLPKKIAILRIGTNKFTKDGVDSSFDIDDSDADNIIENHRKRGRSLCIDDEHASLTGGPAPAKAWIKDLQRVGDKIVAIIEMFTPEAKKQLASGAMRYLSPVVQFKDGKAVGVHSIGSTSHPSLHNPPDFLAASDLTAKSQELDKHLNAAAGIFGAFSDIATDLASVMDKAAKIAQGNPELEKKFMTMKAKIEGGEVKSFADESSFPNDPERDRAAGKAAYEANQSWGFGSGAPSQELQNTGRNNAIGSTGTIGATTGNEAPKVAPDYNGQPLPDEAPKTGSDINSKLSAMRSSMKPEEFRSQANQLLMNSKSGEERDIIREHISKSMAPGPDEPSAQDQERAANADAFNKQYGFGKYASATTNDKGAASMTAPTQPQAAPAAAAPAPAQAPQPAEVASSFSDASLKSIAGLIQLSDTASPAEVTQRINQMSKFCGAASSYFKIKGVQSFADLEKGIGEGLAKKDSEIKALNDKIFLSDCTATIEKYMRAGMISESTKDMEIECLKAMGKENYSKLMDRRKQIIPLTDTRVVETLSKPQPAASGSIPVPASFAAASAALGFDEAAFSDTLDWMTPPTETIIKF